MKKGTLYGIGVGPGDPELVTIKAAYLLQNIKIIFAPFSSKNTYSLALDIISPYIKRDTQVIKLSFPMTKDENVLEDAWNRNAEIIVSYLNKGEDCAFVTLGDPMTYSTFGYIKKVIEEEYPDIAIKIIPGITSYHAAAARAGKILAESEESFVVISGAMGAEKLRKAIHCADHIVVLKVYKNFSEIKDALEEMNLIDKAVLVSRCGLEGEEVVEDIRSKDITPSYLSLLIIDNKGGLKKDEQP